MTGTPNSGAVCSFYESATRRPICHLCWFFTDFIRVDETCGACGRRLRVLP